MMRLLLTTWRTFIRNLKRYRVLLPALVLITAVLTMVLGTVLGIRENMYEKASRYFAGNVVVLGYKGDGDSLIENPEEVLQTVRRIEARGMPVRAYSRRSTFYEKGNIVLFFSGNYLKQRRLVGVEWELERTILNDFGFAAGSVPPQGDESAVLISTAAADQLNIDVGDELVVSIRTDRGRTNTAELIVRGIYSESSFFGYQTYMHRRTLNRLRETPEDEVNIIGVYLKNPIRNEKPAVKLLAEVLARDLPTFGAIETREAYRSQAHRERDIREYGVVSMGTQLEEIEDLLGAVTMITGVIVLMFLSIVAVGVSNTFSMLVWERTREIGTLRALGMQQLPAVLTFLYEAAFLGLSAALFGLLLGVGSLNLIQYMVRFPEQMVTTLFLNQGRLPWQLPGWAVLFITAIVLGASVFGSLKAAVRAGKMSPLMAMNRRT